MINVKELMNKAYEIERQVLEFLKAYNHLQVYYFDNLQVFLGIDKNIVEKSVYVTSWERGLMFRFIYLKTFDGWISLHKSIFESYKNHPFFFEGIEAIAIVERNMFEVQPTCSIYFTDKKELEKLVNEINIEMLVDEVLSED